MTDAEIRELDAWIRQNTLEKFGPVRRVKPMQVFELGFEGIQESSRHKSGVAVRFPRILRWRTDKRGEEADTLATAARVDDRAPETRVTFDALVRSRGWKPFAFQREVWDAYRAGESGLVHAATGTGKTLAAWGGPLADGDEQTHKERRQATPRKPCVATRAALRVLWLTPLRALAADTARRCGRRSTTRPALDPRDAHRRHLRRRACATEPAAADRPDHDAGIALAAADARGRRRNVRRPPRGGRRRMARADGD